MKKINILLFLILNFFGSENLDGDFIQPTEENVKLFNSYFENPEIIESRNFIKDSFQDWSNDYFGDIKNILKYGEEEQISEDPNSYTKKKALTDLYFIKDKIEQKHGARLVLDKWFFDKLDELIEIAKNKILNSKSKNERLGIITKCIEPLEDRISKNLGGHFYITIYKYSSLTEDNLKLKFKSFFKKKYKALDKFDLIPYIKNNNLYIRIKSFDYDQIDLSKLNDLKNTINKFFLKNYQYIDNLIFDIRDNGGGNISEKIINIFLGQNINNKLTIISFINDINKINNKEDIKKANFFGAIENKKINQLSYKYRDLNYHDEKKYITKNVIILMNKKTYSDSLKFIDKAKLIVDKKNLILIGENSAKDANYVGVDIFDISGLPSRIGEIHIPKSATISESRNRKYNEGHSPDIYKNYDHIDNPDKLIDTIVADVKAYKLNKDDFYQPIDKNGFVIPNKKYYPKLQNTINKI